LGKTHAETAHHVPRNANDRLQRRCYDTGKSQIIQRRFFNMGAQVPYKATDAEFKKIQ
jgi:hypothetical protein